MKRICKAALCFLPFVALILGVNLYADPANVLRTGYERSVAEIMADGQNASNIRNMDDRLFMQEYVRLREQPVNTLVLGSSHCMQITSALTGDPNTFCAGVTGADLRDCISIYRLFRENGFSPRRVILTVDCWFFSAGSLEGRAMTDGYAAFCAENGFSPVGVDGKTHFVQKLSKLTQAVSLPYFQSSVEYLRKGLDKTRDPVPTQDFYSETDMRRADGSYGYNAALRDVTPEKADAMAADYMLVKPEFARNFNGVSDALSAQLEAFVAGLRADGVEVALMLAPFQNDYYDYMVAQTDNYVEILATEQLVREIAARTGAAVFGSYNPYACGLTKLDFYDGLHCSDTAMYSFYPADLFSGKHGQSGGTI